MTHAADEAIQPVKTPFLSNKMYDFWKYVAQIFLPAMGALYFALSQIWGLPYGEEVIGTITAVDIFLGALLLLSSNTYNKAVDGEAGGTLMVDRSETDPLLYLELDAPIDTLPLQKQIMFRVKESGK